MRPYIAFALVVLVGFGVYFIWLRPGALNVIVRPRGVSVRINGVLAPSSVEGTFAASVLPGTHVVEVAGAGLESASLKVDIATGQTVTLTQSIAPTGMVYVEGGLFTMGDDEGAFPERPAHTVTLDPFFADRTEVRVGAFRRFRQAYVPPFAGDDMPATGVTWSEAKAYCVSQGKRLPTEAEWERGCRGGDNRSYAYGATFDASVARTGLMLDAGPTRVGTYPPNREGLHDLTGNVWEWCADWYDRRAYEREERINPQGPAFGTRHVLRGGAWYSNARFSKCTHRPGNFRAQKDRSFGFRCVRDIH